MLDADLRQVQCNSFAPVFGRGCDLQPWTTKVRNVGSEPASGENIDDEEAMTASEKFEAGWDLFERSFCSLAPKLKELKVCTDEELKLARESLGAYQRSSTSDDGGVQLFCLPDGTIFQWWATKPE